MIKNITAILGVLVAVASLSFADSAPEAAAQDTKKMVQNNFVETAQKGVKLSGYVDAGYSYNFTGTNPTDSNVNGRFGSDTAQKGDFNLYAVKIALEKALTSENSAQAGFRADVMIGEDANYLSNRTNTGDGLNNDQNSNALFLEQAYVSIRAPVGNGWDFKVGKFVSILGYEVVERPANMNVTYGLLWQQFPLFYTGVLSSYKFDDYIDGKLGVVNGSNNDNNTTTSDNGDGCAVLASLNLTAPGGNANWSNNFQYSTNPENDTGVSTTANSTFVQGATGANQSGSMVIYNSWGNWSPKFADSKLLFAFDSVLGNFNSPTAATTWYGAAAYAKYQFNDWFSLAGRGEYIGSNNSGKIGTNGSQTTQGSAFGHNTGENLWEYTLTAGFNVIDNLLIRAEYRLDWGAGTVGGVSAGGATPDAAAVPASGGPAHYAGAEVVYSF
ncbi:MAG: outer membrane beta-barrel protein [Verrucomicrobia bacterium]|nr:outer membrane beta-barrel protein [Verrucomicrobiota bacterium]